MKRDGSLRVHENSGYIPILIYVNPRHSLQVYFLKIHFAINLLKPSGNFTYRQV
jgi:hypothetical protein